MSSTTVTTTLCDGCREEKSDESKGWRHVRCDSHYLTEYGDWCSKCWKTKPAGAVESVAELEKQVALRDARVTELEALYDRKDETISELHAAVDKLKYDLAVALRRAADLDQHGTEMSEAVEHVEREAARHREYADHTIENLRGQIKVKDEQLEHVRKLNAELQDRIRELCAVEAEYARRSNVAGDVYYLLNILGKKARRRHSTAVAELELKYQVPAEDDDE